MAWRRLMYAFAGTQLSAGDRAFIARHEVAGLTLFRHHNVASVAQVRALTTGLQQAAAAHARPLLVATDQEGGQLQAMGQGATPFPGPMALGAAGDEVLAERVASATARELRALGVNVNYAPNCDLATNPRNSVLGVRSFGDDPDAVGRLAAATVRGLQAQGVAAAVKHFPGGGEAASDPHHSAAVTSAPRETLHQRELQPFRMALVERPWLVMAGHFATPALTGDDRLPASAASAVVRALLRDELGFDGLAITDALDMAAMSADRPLPEAVTAALEAGHDLLLASADPAVVAQVGAGLDAALVRGLLDGPVQPAFERRLAALREWLAAFAQPPLSTVACAEHLALAAEVAARSVTLLRDDDRLLPLRRPKVRRVLVVQTQPHDLTPADTTSTLQPMLAAALRRRLGAGVEELVLPAVPSAEDAAAAAARTSACDLVVVATDAAHLRREQAALAAAILATDRPTVTVALRTPWDLPAYPQAGTHACSYGMQPPSIEALAASLAGDAPFLGRLPVEAAPLYGRGAGLIGPGLVVR
jgi:beta-N-acetylhexosaminidase